MGSYPRCPYHDDRYQTALVPVDGSSGLPFPTHYKRFIVQMFTFVDSASLVPLKEMVPNPVQLQLAVLLNPAALDPVVSLPRSTSTVVPKFATPLLLTAVNSDAVVESKVSGAWEL